MRILLEECVPLGLKRNILSMGHDCQTVREVGSLGKNGELLALAEGRWDLLLTTDRQIRNQQQISGRNIAILILRAKKNRLKDLLPNSAPL
jgi:predicted nuclease of predicted toxin-antitoxin system